MFRYFLSLECIKVNIKKVLDREVSLGPQKALRKALCRICGNVDRCRHPLMDEDSDQCAGILGTLDLN